MSKKKQETLALFRDSFELTRQLTNEQFGILMRAVYAYRFLGEDPVIEEPVIQLSLGFVTAQVDRYEEYCHQNREAANARYAKKKEAREEEKEEALRTEAAKGCENE